MNVYLRSMVLGFFVAGFCLAAEPGDSSSSFRGLQGEGPWTSLNTSVQEENFKFMIFADRTGGTRKGVFRTAVEKCNLLQPDFVMSVGDLIMGYTTDADVLNEQWDEFDAMVDDLDAPFFYLPGNHDYNNPEMAAVWAQRYKPSYYHFIYKEVLFLGVNSEEKFRGDTYISAEQNAYFQKVLDENPAVRWTFIFLHEPLWLYGDDGRSTGWKILSDALEGREYTVFAGHFHSYTQYTRHGMDHIVLATTGGGSGLDGAFFGEFEHLTHVSFIGGKPVISNLMLDGIHGVKIRDEQTNRRSSELGEKLLVQCRMPSPGSVVFGRLNGEIKIENQSDMPVTFEFDLPPDDAQPYSLALNRDQLQLQPGTKGEIELTLQMKSETPIDDFPLPEIPWAAVFTPEGYGESRRENTLTVGVDAERICPVLKPGARIEIDGALDDWDALPYHLSGKERVHYSGNWSGSEDAGFSFGVTRDDQTLYIAMSVIDDFVGVDAEKEAYEVDSVSLFLDARPRVDRADGLSTKTQFKTHLPMIIAPGERPETPNVYLQEKFPEGTQVACVQTDVGYDAEVAIPLRYLDDFQGGAWDSFQLNVIVRDPDVNGVSVLHWRPDWYRSGNFKDSGTFIRSDE